MSKYKYIKDGFPYLENENVFEYDNIFTTLPCDYSNFIFEHYFLVREDFDET